MPQTIAPPGVPHARGLALILALVWLAPGSACLGQSAPEVAPGSAAHVPPRLALPAPTDGLGSHPLPRSEAATRPAGGTGGWWLGPTGIVLALAAFGGLSYALRRPGGGGSVGSMEIVGRLAVAPRQSVVLLRAGDRVLLLGVGGQGPPSLLGELEEEPLAASTTPAPAPNPAPNPPSGTLDARPLARPAATTVRLGEVSR